MYSLFFTKLHFPGRLANIFGKRFANMELSIGTKFVFLLWSNVEYKKNDRKSSQLY
jgi:hypothetical protein